MHFFSRRFFWSDSTKLSAHKSTTPLPGSSSYNDLVIKFIVDFKKARAAFGRVRWRQWITAKSSHNKRKLAFKKVTEFVYVIQEVQFEDGFAKKHS